MKKILIYGTPGCPSCVQAKKFLEDKEIAFEYVSVGEGISAKDFIQKTGSQSVPVIFIDDEKHIGWNPSLFN